jgi:phosphatidylglycerol---prolipoprotein diacylglyceryl transferase
VRRVLFRWRGTTIYSYPALLYLGLVLGIVVGNVAAHRTSLPPARVFAATLLLLPPALIGGRLAFVAGHWRFYRRHPRLILSRSEGGAAMYGGLPLSLAVSVPLLRAFDLPFGAFWDVATFTILVGMVCTRIGCLLNGCCAGRPTSSRVGMYLPDHLGKWTRRTPTQPMEFVWALLLLAGALIVWPRLPFDGALFLYLLGGYGLGRLALESCREHAGASRWSVAQHGISAGLVAGALVGLVMGWPR